MTLVDDASQVEPKTSTGYDVFISYSHLDGEWVVKWLLPQLEQARVKACIDFRNFDIGVAILTNIQLAVEQSRHTLLILSPAWVTSAWTELEALLTQTADPAGRARRIIPILLEECQPPKLISMLAYADFRNQALWDVEFQRVLQAINGELQLPHLRPSLVDLSPKRPGHKNRKRVLANVRKFWVKGVLEDSLQTEALIALGMEERGDLVFNPWAIHVQESRQIPHEMLPNAKISEVFQANQGELLILGAPGAGKTTLLLDLTRDLLNRAEHDEEYPIPIVFNLASWSARRLPLANWLLDELYERYSVPKKIGQAWIEADQILLLLDGLDEVQHDYRVACVEAINTYRTEHNVSLAVCSRIADYEMLNVRLKLESAVLIQPLTPAQIDQYLTNVGARAAALREALKTDSMLRKLATTPLLLSILVLTCSSSQETQLQGETSEDQARVELFRSYVDVMLSRGSKNPDYSLNNTILWLHRLANYMYQRKQSEFLIERMQPDWLSTPRQRWLYSIWVGLLGGLLLGLVAFLGSWFAFSLAWGLLWGVSGPLGWFLSIILSVGLSILRNAAYLSLDVVNPVNIPDAVKLALSTLTFGLFSGVIITLKTAWYLRPGNASAPVEEIKLFERLRWSWSNAAKGLGRGLITGIVIMVPLVLTLVLSGVSPVSIENGFLGGLGWGLALGFVLGLILSITHGLKYGDLTEQTTPNQGIKQSARNSVLVGLVVGPGIWVGTMLIVQIASILDRITEGIPILDPVGDTLNELVTNTIVQILSGTPYTRVILGLACALALGLGGFTCIQHLTLRFVLWHNNRLPWRYAKFLDYSANKLLLRKVGGGYIFIHKMLLVYFAAIQVRTSTHRKGDQL